MEHNRSLAAEYEAGAALMDELHDGQNLATAADRAEQELPDEALALLATSPEGAAIAAVCASRRSSPTTWRLIHLGYPPAIDSEATVVFVEPVDPGRGWQAAVKRHYPDARFLFTGALPTTSLKAVA